ncbi:hypothetical protein [Streptomyces sp. CoH27]
MAHSMSVISIQAGYGRLGPVVKVDRLSDLPGMLRAWR